MGAISSTPRARAPVTALCVIPGTAYLLVASADGSATFYDFSNQSVCGRWDNLSEPSACAAFYTTIVTAKDAVGAAGGPGPRGDAAAEAPQAPPLATHLSPSGRRGSPGSPTVAAPAAISPTASPSKAAAGWADAGAGVEEQKGDDEEEDEDEDAKPNMLVSSS